MIPLLTLLGLPARSEERWLVRADAGDDVSEEAEEVCRDPVDVAGKTVPADEQERVEVATASRRRPEDTECAFIVPLLLKARNVQSVSRQMQQQLPDTNRVEQRVVGAGVSTCLFQQPEPRPTGPSWLYLG